MIRVYFDSDVINNIREGRFPELATFINENRGKLLIPFSQAHISDKLPSKEQDEARFYNEIDFISDFTNNKFLLFDDKKELTVPLIATARAVLNEVEDNNRIIDEFGSIDNILSFLKDTMIELDFPNLIAGLDDVFNAPVDNPDLPEYLKGSTFKEQLQNVASHMHSLRNDAAKYKENDQFVKSHIGLPSHSGQWTDNTIDKIDNHLSENSIFESFMYLLDIVFQGNYIKKTRYSYFTTAYSLLNMIGFKSDEINIEKNKGMDNHLQDAMHSFYAGHCDYFVAMDKKLVAKTKALYDKFNINTKIAHPKDFIEELNSKIKEISLSDLINETLNYFPVGTIEEEGILKKLYRLDHYFLDYFTHLQINYNPGINETTYIFTKMYSTYSEVLFYEEEDHVIKEINKIFGKPEFEQRLLEKFKSQERFIDFIFKNAYIKLNLYDGVLFLWIQLTNNIDE